MRSAIKPREAPPPDEARYRNQATQRVLAGASAFVRPHPGPCGGQPARALCTNKNMVHRALTTLTEAGYLARAADGERYQLGPRILELQGGEADEFDIRALCRPFLEELYALTEESVFLSIVVGPSRVNIDWIEARGRRVGNSLRGRPVPLHCTRMSRGRPACPGGPGAPACLAR